MLTVAEGGVLGAWVIDAHPPMRNAAAKQARAGLMGNFIRRRINFVFMVLVSSWLFVVNCLFSCWVSHHRKLAVDLRIKEKADGPCQAARREGPSVTGRCL